MPSPVASLDRAAGSEPAASPGALLEVDRISIDFVLFSASTSLIWLIILLLAIGFLGGVMLSQLYRRRRRILGSAADEPAGPDR